MKKIIVISLIAFFVGWFVNQKITAQKHKVNRISVIEFKEVLLRNNKIQIIDVRTLSEYKKGYIKDAVLMDVMKKDDFKTKTKSLDKLLPTYIYCHSGVRSLRALKILKKEGFVDIWDVREGYKGWLELKKQNLE